MRTKNVVAAAGALVMLAVPAGATETVTPTTSPLVTYFHCTGDSRVLNALLLHDPPSWNTEPPSDSVQAGSGCGFADPGSRTGTYQENVYDAVFKGSYAGNLDSLTVRLYDMGAGGSRMGFTQQLDVRLSVDGTSMFGMVTPAEGPTDLVFGAPVPVPAPGSVNVQPFSGNLGVTNSVEFTVTGLRFLEEDGAGALEREILLTINSRSEHASMWVLDTTEVPSGITFNPPTAAPAKLAATTPGAASTESR